MTTIPGSTDSYQHRGSFVQWPSAVLWSDLPLESKILHAAMVDLCGGTTKRPKRQEYAERRELAAGLGMDPHRVSKFLAPLRDAGMVDLQNGPHRTLRV